MNDRLSIALEPEAAALYCRFLPVEKLTGSSQGEEISQLKTFSPGAQYLIVDLGGKLHFYKNLFFLSHTESEMNFSKGGIGHSHIVTYILS